MKKRTLPGLALLNVAVLAGCSATATSDSQASDTTSSSEVVAEPLDTSTADDDAEPVATDSSDSAADVEFDEADLGAVGTLASDSTHSISIEFDDADYDAMIATYTATQEKEWIEATVTIDGVTYEQAGIRLKGNSSLRGIANTGGGPMSDSADADAPETLPWLIKLDKFVEGQNHDGLTELVVRSNTSETSLNEAVALELLSMAGLASQDAIAAGFSVNGSDPVLRLVIDNPDDEWMSEELGADGALYKAEAGGDYSYRGDDPEAYADVFDQEAGEDNADLTPLTDFLDFINSSDDATFEAELADHLDIEAFATYLAMQELLDNFDDIDGPGNNSYLYYDTESGVFTVVPWDYNLAFGQGPGGGNGRGGAGGMQPPADGDFGGDLGGGAEPPDFGDMQPPNGGAGGGFGGMGGSNILVARFLAVDSWQALYDSTLAELQSTLIESGVADGVLAAWTEIVESSGLVDAGTVAQESSSIADRLG